MSTVRYSPNPATAGTRLFATKFRLAATVFALGWASIDLPNMPSAAGQSHGASPVISPGFTIDAPGHIVAHNWSGDSRHVALLFWNPPIYILDIKNRSLTNTAIVDVPVFNAFLNDDAKLLLAPAGREARLYSTVDNKLLTRVNEPVQNCGFPDGHSVAFLPNSRYVWIGCNLTSDNPPKVAALRYTLPTLELSDTAVNPAQHKHFWLTGTTVELAGASPILTGFTRGLRGDPRAGAQVTEYSFNCLHLDTQTPCFPAIAIENLLPGKKRVWALSTDLRLAAISTDMNAIYIYDTATTTLARTLNFAPGPYLRSIAFVNNDNMLIAGFGDSRLTEGQLVTWNVRSGAILQEISGIPVAQMSVSPDLRKLIVITNRNILLHVITGQ